MYIYGYDPNGTIVQDYWFEPIVENQSIKQ